MNINFKEKAAAESSYSADFSNYPEEFYNTCYKQRKFSTESNATKGTERF